MTQNPACRGAHRVHASQEHEQDQSSALRLARLNSLYLAVDKTRDQTVAGTALALAIEILHRIEHVARALKADLGIVLMDHLEQETDVEVRLLERRSHQFAPDRGHHLEAMRHEIGTSERRELVNNIDYPTSHDRLQCLY